MPTQEIILKPDGQALLRTISEAPCNIVNSLAERLSSSTPRVVKRLFSTTNESIGVVATGTEVYLGCRVTSIELNMHWRMEGNTLLPFPVSKKDVATGIVVKLKWEPRGGMHLAFLARIHKDLHIENRHCFLLALDSSGRNFRLPLPNIYDDCSICMGEFDSSGQSYLEVFQKALTQFRNAGWNSDLMDGEKLAKLEKLIRYKVVKGEQGDTFEQDGNGNLWWNQCYGCETRVSDAARRLL